MNNLHPALTINHIHIVLTARINLTQNNKQEIAFSKLLQMIMGFKIIISLQIHKDLNLQVIITNKVIIKSLNLFIKLSLQFNWSLPF